MTPRAYYNEIDPFCVETLRNLIDAGLIADGDVDDRSIEDVTPDDLRGYTQCHFFAGLGLWSAAAKRAGWPDDRELWTASCPCQPFSQAGARGGFDDERHLWPSLHWLIQHCAPRVVVGEQVTGGAAGAWLDLVCDDFDGMGYAVRAQIAPAARYGQAMRRERLYWTADAGGCVSVEGSKVGGSGGRMGNTDKPGRSERQSAAPSVGRRRTAITAGRDSGLSLASGEGLEGAATQEQVRADGQQSGRGAAELIWLRGLDGRARPIEPGIEPLAYGLPRRVDESYAWANVVGDLASHLAAAKRYRVGALKSLGNAIVLPQAVDWMQYVLETTG